MSEIILTPEDKAALLKLLAITLDSNRDLFIKNKQFEYRLQFSGKKIRISFVPEFDLAPATNEALYAILKQAKWEVCNIIEEWIEI